MAESTIKNGTSTSERAYRRKILVHSTLRLIVCILLTIICLLPIYILLVNSTRESTDIAQNGITFIPGTYLINNLQNLFDPDYQNGILTNGFNLGYGYLNSFIIAISSAALSTFFSGLTAYGLTVYDFKLKKAATTFILAIMMIPMQVVSTGFLQFMIQIKLTDTYIPIILPSIAAPAVVFYMLQYMKSSFPLEIVEAARIDGCGEFHTFLSIALPILRPAFAVQAIFTFVSAWNNYYTPSMILLSNKLEQRTMPMMVQAIISNDKVSDYGIRYLVICLSIIPVVVVYLILSKFIIAGVALGGVKE